jgi:hypothetical protein
LNVYFRRKKKIDEEESGRKRVTIKKKESMSKRDAGLEFVKRR